MKGMFVLITKCLLELGILYGSFLDIIDHWLKEHNSTEVLGVQLAINLCYEYNSAKPSWKNDRTLDGFVMPEPASFLMM